MPGIAPENPLGRALVPPLSAVSCTHAHTCSGHTHSSVLSHPLAAVCSTILSPHVLLSPCHQCECSMITRFHMCTYVDWGCLCHPAQALH